MLLPRVRRSTIYALPARFPAISFVLAVSFAITAACVGMLGCTALLMVTIDKSILAIANFVAVFPDFVTWASYMLWRAVWVICLLVCAVCALFNLLMIGSLAFVLARRFWIDWILPFYTLFCNCLDDRLQTELARERREEERVAKKILERVLCADVAGEISKYAGFHNAVPMHDRPREQLCDGC